MTRKIHELAALATDAYKFSHKNFYPEGTEFVYSNLTPRTNSYFKYSDKYLSFGSEMFVQRFLIDFWNKNFFELPKEEVVEDFMTILNAGGLQNTLTAEDIGGLHDLGYLPLIIKALPEGIEVPVGIPLITVENTLPEYFWLTNFIETALISEVYPVVNSASIALQYNKVAHKWSNKTCDNDLHIPWQFHDFSRRGHHGNDAGTTIALGHMTSFKGSDSIQGAIVANNYYQADVNDVYGSVMATEHSVASAYGRDGEYDYYKELIKRNPTGILSMVSDTYDYWNVLTNILPSLKEDILARDGKLVVRPDSGNIIDMIAGKKIHDIDLSELEEHETLAHYEWEIEQLASYQASEDCEGSYNCGDDSYEVVVKTKEGHFSVWVDFEYNRHDKTYYYIENSKVNWNTLKKLDVNESEVKGSLELLWETFGGTVNEKGYKVLDQRIGLIYGDSVTLDNVNDIFEAMERKGFASSNVVLGIGAYSYSVINTRDAFAMAFKTTAVLENGKVREVQKDPVTDQKKKSATGYLRVIETEEGIKLLEKQTVEEECFGDSLLEEIFYNGHSTRKTPFKTITNNIKKIAQESAL